MTPVTSSRVAVVLALLAAPVDGHCDTAATGGEDLEFRGSHELTIMADTLRSEVPLLPARDSQLSVWWASDLRLRCTRATCRELTIRARPWVGTFLGPTRPDPQRDLRDIHQKITIRAQELYVSVTPLAAVAVKAGSMTTGWGPGILFSPTNRLVPETMFSSHQRQVRGRPMMSATVHAADPVTVTVIAAPTNRDADNAFTGKRGDALLTRIDYQGSGQRALNGGFVGGVGQVNAPYAGAYGQLLLNDAVTIAAEGSLSRGYGRGSTTSGVQRPPARLTADVSVSMRYGLSSGGEIAVEGVFNGFGQQIVPRDLFSLDGEPRTVSTALHPLSDQRYLTLQARLPRLPPGQRVTVTASVTAAQPSHGIFAFGEVAYSRKHWRAFVAASGVQGPSAFRLLLPFSQSARVGIHLYQ